MPINVVVRHYDLRDFVAFIKQKVKYKLSPLNKDRFVYLDGAIEAFGGSADSTPLSCFILSPNPLKYFM